jgi:hypothetical protein
MSTPTDATRSPPGLATDTGLSQLHLRRPPEGIGGFDLGTRSDSLVATPGGSSRGGCIKRPISSLDEAGSDPRDVIERDQALNHSDQDGPGTDMRAGEGIALQSVTPETSTCSGTNSAPWVFTRNSRTWPELPTAVSPTQSHSTPESFHSAAGERQVFRNRLSPDQKYPLQMTSLRLDVCEPRTGECTRTVVLIFYAPSLPQTPHL